MGRRDPRRLEFFSKLRAKTEQELAEFDAATESGRRMYVYDESGERDVTDDHRQVLISRIEDHQATLRQE